MPSRSSALASLVAVVALYLTAPPLGAQQVPPQPPPAQQPPFQPFSGMPGKDVVWVPTHPTVVERMLDMAKVTAQDFVVDLGSGDGRNVIAAARRGATAVGFEYNPDMVELSRKLAKEAGVADKATFVQGDMYEADFSQATVLALFLLPSNLEKLKDKILALKPGTRVVLNTFTIAGWEPDETDRLEGECGSWCNVLLHYIPAKVEGTWRGNGVELALTQTFQKVFGTAAVGGASSTIQDGLLRADRLTFSAGGTSFTGRVDGDRIVGTATTAGPTNKRDWTLTRDRK
ncbi:MAG: class I SAM-dependent methyltransferase [Acidobacteriota bacterium]